MNRPQGFTLVELMITVAVIAVIAAIAIPAYNGYIREGHYTTIRATINQLRTPIEDTRLEEGGYGTTGSVSDFDTIKDRFNVDDDLDPGVYNYTVVVVSTTNYHIWGRLESANTWLRCEDRASRCCDSNGSNNPANACD